MGSLQMSHYNRSSGYGRSSSGPPNPWRVKVGLKAADIPLVNGAANVDPSDHVEVTLVGAPATADGKPATLTAGVEGAGKTWREGGDDCCYLYLQPQPDATAMVQRYGLAFVRYLPDIEGRAARTAVAEAEKAAATAVATAVLELARALEAKLDADEAKLRTAETEQRIADEKRTEEARAERAADDARRENSVAAHERKEIVARMRAMTADDFRALASTLEFQPRERGTAGPGPQGQKLLEMGAVTEPDSLRVFLDGADYPWRPLLLSVLKNGPDGERLMATKVLQDKVD